jgi:DNA polymerase-3 subunit epsilon
MWKLRLRRLLYKRRVAGTALQDCWQKPLPSTGTDWNQVSLLVVDAEMSSLDVNEGELLSVGWVCVEDGSIALASAEHYLIKPENSVGQSATIHNLRDCELEDARSGDEVLVHFLRAAAGKILVFHNAALDMAFLNRVSRLQFNAPILMPVVDTLLQEQQLMQRRELPIKSGDLRLQACRERYNLPQFPAHNALLDALATAELLIALCKHRSLGQEFALGPLLVS